MKRNIVAFIFAILLLLSLHSRGNQTLAVTTEEAFTSAYSQYNEKLADYNKARDDYVLARAQYLKFKTQRSETDAFNATLRFLQTRDEVVVLYLDTLEKKLDAAVGVSNAQNSALKFAISEEKQWFNQHKVNLLSAGTLKDLVADSDKAEDRYQEDHALFYQVLSVVSFGKVIDYQERSEELIMVLKDRLEGIKNEEVDGYKLSFDKSQTIDRWLVESENKIARSEEKQVKIEDEMLKFEDNKKKARASSIYNSVLKIATESRQLLKESTTMLLEVIREVKTK
jgi:hypothetical protein